jgi:hypothetical protein
MISGAGEVLRNQAKVFNSDEDVSKGVKGLIFEA